MATSFEDFVDRQHQMASETEPPVDWAEELKVWKCNLDEFFTKVLEFLRPYIEQNKIRVERVKKHIHE